MRTTLTAVIHGESGVGKSWLGDTVPAPRLILDAEGRAKYTPSGPKVMWDPRTGPPPAYDGTWETCIVPVVDYWTLDAAYAYLRAGQHHFVSVVIDSIMEAQKRCIDAIVGTNAMDPGDWGTLLRNLEGLVRKYRDLTLLPENGASVVVFVVGSRKIDGRMQPLLQGALQETLPYYIDVVGYLFKQEVPDASGTNAYQRVLLIDQQPGFVAKDNTGRLVSTLGPLIRVGEGGYTIAQLVDLLHVQGKPEAVPAAATTAAPAAEEAA